MTAILDAILNISQRSMMPEWHQLDSSSTMPQQQESIKKKTLKSSSRSFWFSSGLNLFISQNLLLSDFFLYFIMMFAYDDPGGWDVGQGGGMWDRGSGPRENHKTIRFLGNTGPDSLKITKLSSQHSNIVCAGAILKNRPVATEKSGLCQYVVCITRKVTKNEWL